MRYQNLKLLKPVHEGRCLAFADSLTFLVRGGLPGEIVEVEVTSQKKRLVWAEVTKVVSPSQWRIDPIWPFGQREQVGGFDLGQVSYAGQEVWKTAVLADCLERLGKAAVWSQCQPFFEDVVVRNPQNLAHSSFAVRTRVEYEIDEERRPAMYREGTHDLVPIKELPMATAVIDSAGLCEKETPLAKRWKVGQRVRAGSGDNGVKVAIGEDVFDPHGRQSDPYLFHSVKVGTGSFRYRVDLRDFWQAHQDAPRLLSETLLDMAARFEGNVGWELFSGSGLFTLPLAAAGDWQIETLEGATRACESARFNVRENALSGTVKTHCGSVKAATLRDFAAPDWVVLDPPRSGLGTVLAKFLAQVGAKDLVYVACDPAALARDLQVLLAGGYEICDVRAWNLFPYTHHFESLVHLRRSV